MFTKRELDLLWFATGCLTIILQEDDKESKNIRLDDFDLGYLEGFGPKPTPDETLQLELKILAPSKKQ